MLDVGHIPSQLAACERATGLALVPRAPLLALRGPAASLASLTARLTGGRRRLSGPVRIRCGWWQSVSAHRALLLADADEQLTALIDDVVRPTADVAVEDLSASYACVVLTGPLAGRLAADPAVQLMPTSMTVCDGEQQRLFIVPRLRADTLRRALLQAGRAAGVIAVEPQAAQLRGVARRSHAVQIDPYRQEPVP